MNKSEELKKLETLRDGFRSLGIAAKQMGYAQRNLRKAAEALCVLYENQADQFKPKEEMDGGNSDD